MVVPNNEEIFVVPNKVATWYYYKAANVAGVCTLPPPPTMESIKTCSKWGDTKNNNFLGQ